MTDKYKFHDDVKSPARAPFEVTPDDNNDLAIIPKSIYVGGTGTIKLIGDTGTSNCSFVAIPAGTILPVRARRIFSTGTTATNIVALV